jgi:Thioesterase-like superfamily
LTSSTSFTDAMALTLTAHDGDRYVFRGVLNEHWTIGPKVHGGAMLALCANGARSAHGGGAEPVAVSGSFLWAPDPGPMDVAVTLRKLGRRVSLADVELTQGERTAVRVAVTLGAVEDSAPLLLSAHPVVPLMAPEPPAGLEPIGPGHPMEHIVHLAHGCDIRPSLVSMAPRGDGGVPVFEYWVRPKDCAPDALFALMCTDVSAPVTFAVNRMGWAPTIQLTAYLRALPADGWLRIISTTTQIGQDWFDEDHLVVDSAGRLVAQSRQLAMVPSG